MPTYRTKREVDSIRNSRQWRDRTRPAKLDKNPLCEVCFKHKPPKVKPATQVDHITPLEEGGEPFDESNLQSLCNRCHSIKSAEESRQRHRRKAAEMAEILKENEGKSRY